MEGLGGPGSEALPAHFVGRRALRCEDEIALANMLAPPGASRAPLLQAHGSPGKQDQGEVGLGRCQPVL